MMRVETVTGILYFGDVFFGTEFIRVVPNQILIYSKESDGYMELGNIPKEVFIPISRIEVIAQLKKETNNNSKFIERLLLSYFNKIGKDTKNIMI